MRYSLSVSTRWAMALLVLFLAVPNTFGQSRAGGEDAKRATPRDPAPAPQPAAQPAPAPAAAAAPAPVNESNKAVGRTTPRTVEATRSGSPETAQQNQGARPRDGRPTVGTAVPRGSVPSPRINVVSPPIRYYRGYSPWGFGGLGFGSYYGNFYDPYVFYDPFSPWYGSYGRYAYGYPAYGYGYPTGYGYSSSYSIAPDGELRLKIKPRDAQVFVDGYFVGIVDDFDGVFQRLHLPSGPHRIEVRAPGYETLTFDVQIRFDETTKYQGELRRIQ